MFLKNFIKASQLTVLTLIGGIFGIVPSLVFQWFSVVLLFSFAFFALTVISFE